MVDMKNRMFKLPATRKQTVEQLSHIFSFPSHSLARTYAPLYIIDATVNGLTIPCSDKRDTWMQR